MNIGGKVRVKAPQEQGAEAKLQSQLSCGKKRTVKAGSIVSKDANRYEGYLQGDSSSISVRAS